MSQHTKPFFARFLEQAAAAELDVEVSSEAGRRRPRRTQKSPSDRDEMMETMKYPSDSDEGTP